MTRLGMPRFYVPMVVAFVVAVMTAGASALPSARASRAEASPGFLTGPSSETPVAIAVGYLRQHLAEYGLLP